MEDQFARRARRVDHPVTDGSKSDSALTEILDQIDQMTHGTSESIKPPNDERVTRSQHLQALSEPWTIVFGSRQLVGEDPGLRDALLCEGIDLKREVLIVRGDTGVANGPAGHDVDFSGGEPWWNTASSPHWYDTHAHR